MQNYIEQELSEYLDDLLVAAKIEKTRTKQHVTSADEYADSIVNFKMAPRTKIKLYLSKTDSEKSFFTVKYKGATCQFSLLDGCPLTSNFASNIQPILPYIAQMWVEKREYIIQAYHDIMWTKNLKSNKTSDDDSLVCDGFWVENGHGFKQRKRPWLEKDQNTR